MLKSRLLRAVACATTFVALLPTPATAVASSDNESPSSGLDSPVDAVDASMSESALQQSGAERVSAQQPAAALASLPAVADLVGEWLAPGVVSLTWGDVPGADSYEVTALASGEWLLLDSAGDVGGVVLELDGPSALIAGLPADDEGHWFAVRARNAESLAAWSHSVEVAVPESAATATAELPSFDPFTTPTRSGIDLERLRQAVTTITPGDANCASAPALDVTGVTVVDPPASLADPDAPLTVAEVVRIAGGCLVVEYAELAGRTVEQVRELLVGDDSVFAVGVPMRGAQVAHDDGAHRPHGGGHHNDGAGEQWHLPQPAMDRLWGGWKTENPITVAVLDTGVDEDHPDLDDRIVTGGLDACHRKGSTSHGTSMAGIIAAEHDNNPTDAHVAGVAPSAKVLPIHVTPPAGMSATEGCTAVGAYTAAVATAVNDGARVINMSFSVPIGEDGDNTQNVGGVEASSEVTDDTFELALRAAAMLGVVSVAAAGNCGSDTEVVDEGERKPSYRASGCDEKNQLKAPSAFSLQGNVISVGAVDASGERIAASTANAAVDVAAPGKDILPTNRGEPSEVCGTHSVSGTSPAAAFVSGVVAHMLNRYPGATVGQVRAALEYSALEPPATDPNAFPFRSPRSRDGDFDLVPRPTREFGHGIVDPAGAVTQLGRLLLAGVTPKGPHGGFVQLSAGSAHTCGLRASGQVLCWGDRDVVAETPVFAYSSLSSAPTADYVCGVRIDGAVHCWGDVPSALATAVAGSGVADAPEGRFIQVAVGDAHACGLRPDHGVVCWGDNSRDQTDIPFARFGAEPDDRVTAIVAGAAHTCAVTASSDLVCWGDDDEGQLPPSTLPWAVREVAAGASHTCVVNVNSNTVCWGDNTDGQRDVPSGEFVGITAGAHHTCALAADSEAVTCWGRNASGQNDAPGGRFAEVSAGKGHTCALDRFAHVKCWGDKAEGQSNAAELASLTLTDTDSGTVLLGSGFAADTFEYTVQAVGDPVRVDWTLDDGARLGLSVEAFDADGNGVVDGGTVSLATGSVLTLRVSSLFGFGPERTYTVTAEDPPRLGSLSVRAETGAADCPGDGCPPYALVPVFDPGVLDYRVVVPGEVTSVTVGVTAEGVVSVSPPDADAGTDGHQVALTSNAGFASMDAGNSHTCGVLTGGSLRCWGSSYPRRTTVPTGAYSQVSTGWAHACALTTGGRVRCWGDNYFGQSRPSLGSYASVSAGWGHSCGLTTGGRARCWGYNFSGQSRPPSDTFSAVAAGGNHSCGITSAGALKCWGLNNSRQASPPSGTFTSLSAGWKHNCAIKSDATVACWGNSGSGRTSAPGGAFTAVSAGQEHSCGLKTDGTVACWGSDSSEQASPPAGTFVAVSAGEDHSCALSAAGVVSCWGEGSAAQPALPAEVTVTVSSSIEPARTTLYTVTVDRGAAGRPESASAASGGVAEGATASAEADDSLARAAGAGQSAGCSPSTVQFADDRLRSAVEAALGKSAGAAITPAEMSALGELRLSRLGDAGSGPAISDLAGLQTASALTLLDLSGHDVRDLSPLACLTSLETLVLSANSITDMTPLSGLGALRVLWLDRNDITSIAALSGLTNLERLYAYDNDITGVTAIAALTGLQELYLDHNDLGDITGLSSLSSLMALGLGGNKVADLSAVSRMSGLEALYAFDNQVADLSPVRGLGSLGMLWASGNQISDVSPVGSLGGLGYVDVRWNRVSDVSPLDALGGTVHERPQQADVAVFADGVLASAVREHLGLAGAATVTKSALGGVERLVHRAAGAQRIGDLSGLEHASGLVELRLYHHRVRDLGPLVPLEGFERLTLVANGFHDVAQIERLRSLRLLSLTANRITDISALQLPPSVEELLLDENRISDISPLAAATGLWRVELSGNQITDITPLAALGKLRRLGLTRNPIASLEPIRGLGSLEVLLASRTGATDLTALSGLTKLVHLSAARNGITSIEPLTALSGISSIDLRGNGIAGIEPLAALTRLQWLHLANNDIASVEALRGHSALRTLYLAGNRITDFTPIDGHAALTTHGRDNQQPPPGG